MKFLFILLLSLNVKAQLLNPTTDSTIQLFDVTTNNASPLKHGFLPKLENSGTKYLRDDGTWQTVAGGGGSIDMALNSFTANGVSTTFVLNSNPSVEENTFVYLSGVYQNKSTYSVSGTSLIFSTAPASGTSVEVMVGTVSGTSGGGGEVNTASNLGTGAGIFAQKSGVDLQFKSLKSSSGNLSITSSTTEVTLGFTTFPTVDGFATAILGTDAFTPGAGYNNLYFKSDGLYYISPSATVTRMAETTSSQTWTGTPTFNNANVSGAITLSVSSTTASAPPSGSVKFFGKSVGGRSMMAQIGPSGLDTVIQPHIGRNKAVWWQPLGNSTTVPITTGIVAASVSGTATARTVATTNILTRMKRLGYVSGAAINNVAAVYWPAAGQQYTVGTDTLGGFHSIFRLAVADAATVSGARMFAGWRSVVTAPTNVDPATQTNQFGLAQISSDASQWYIVYGGSAAQTAIPLGAGIGAPTLTNTAWDVSFFAPTSASNTISYSVTNLGSGAVAYGTLTGVAGTAIPAGTTLLAPAIWRTNNATALAVAIDVSSIYIETDQ